MPQRPSGPASEIIDRQQSKSGVVSILGQHCSKENQKAIKGAHLAEDLARRSHLELVCAPRLFVDGRLVSVDLGLARVARGHLDVNAVHLIFLELAGLGSVGRLGSKNNLLFAINDVLVHLVALHVLYCPHAVKLPDRCFHLFGDLEVGLARHECANGNLAGSPCCLDGVGRLALHWGRLGRTDDGRLGGHSGISADVRACLDLDNVAPLQLFAGCGVRRQRRIVADDVVDRDGCREGEACVVEVGQNER